MRNDLDRQLDKLAGQLRDTGQAPERDLWPGIADAIDRVEQRQAPRRVPAGPRVWQVAAVAASVILLVGVGFLGVTGPDRAVVADVGQDAPELAQASAPGTDLADLDATLGQLNDALEAYPDNHKLARLAAMVHKSRANVMRRQADPHIR